MSKNLGTDPYKGVRDFYPEDMAIQNQIFDIWKNVVKKYGYEEYNSSVLEPAELFRAKSGEEIINEQTYSFIDRGNREVMLRPEMTPSLARMVASRKRELNFPLRWFSIPNLFRYEQPQRGRLREHWQLNVDILGIDDMQAEIEIIQMAHEITRAYGLSDQDFEIRINNRKIVNYITKDVFGLDGDQAQKIAKLIDKKRRIPGDVFVVTAENILKDEPNGKKSRELITLLNSQNFEEFTSRLPQTKEEHKGLLEIRGVMSGLEKLGITNTKFDQTIMRGFDYYTGIVFEIFDKNPENRRSLFGGGRYDDLISLFGNERVSGVGFGAGDVGAKDLMQTYGKLPKSKSASADIYICTINEKAVDFAQEIAQKIRNSGMKVVIGYSYRKIGDQIKNADKMGIPNIICIGEEEVKTGKLKIKNLKTGDEKDYI